MKYKTAENRINTGFFGCRFGSVALEWHLVGTWEYDDYGAVYTIEFRSDGTGTVTVEYDGDRESSGFDWETSGSTFRLTNEWGEMAESEWEVTRDYGQLIMDGQVFCRV